MITEIQLSQHDISAPSDTSCSSGYVSPVKGWNHAVETSTGYQIPYPRSGDPYSSLVSVGGYKLDDSDLQEFQQTSAISYQPLQSPCSTPMGNNSHHLQQMQQHVHLPHPGQPGFTNTGNSMPASGVGSNNTSLSAGYSHGVAFPFVSNYPFFMSPGSQGVDGAAMGLKTTNGGAVKGRKSGGERPKTKRKRVATVAQRRAANIRERRRMYSLNESFDNLRKKVPTFAYEKKLSRIETLRLAITYISFMGDLLQGKSPDNIRLATRKRLLHAADQDQFAAIMTSSLGMGGGAGGGGYTVCPPPPGGIGSSEANFHINNSGLS